MNTPDKKSFEERAMDRVEQLEASEVTEAEVNRMLNNYVMHAPKRVYFLFFGILLLATFGAVWYAWGNTVVRAEYQGITAYGKHCAAYDEVVWMTPANQELNRPDRWKLYTIRTDNTDNEILFVGTESCRVTQPAACCSLLGKKLGALPPKNLWDKPTWELPKEWR